MNFWLFVETLLGISLVIASACVFNNYLDSDIDKKMSRTSQRAIPAGRINGTAAIIYASGLGVVGFIILAAFTNWLVFNACFIAIFSYVVLYGIAKRRSVHGTLVGSIPGAIPPVAGYLAVTDHLDGAAIILFLILVSWQMPHFYAIAMYRYKDYKQAGLPVITVKKGMRAARFQIMLYIIGFIGTASALTIFGYTGYIYLIVVLILGFYWLGKGISQYTTTDYARWGRQMFLISLVVSIGFSVMVAIGAVLP